MVSQPRLRGRILRTTVGSFSRCQYLGGRYEWSTLTRLRASDGANLGSVSLGTNTGGIAAETVVFDGANIWVAGASANNLLSCGLVMVLSSSPLDVRSSMSHLWLTNTGGSSTTVTKLRPEDGANLGTYTVAAGPAECSLTEPISG